MKEIKYLIQFGASIIDVRSAEKFREDHISTAMNITLNEVVNRIEEFKQPFLVCCLSGCRSKQVTEYLQSINIKCFLAGGMKQLKNLMAD